MRGSRSLGKNFCFWSIFTAGIVSLSAFADGSKVNSVGPKDNVASHLVFGSGEECPHEPYCLPALEKKYGLRFAEFKVTDPGGVGTRNALEKGDIQVGVLFTTNGYLAAKRFVLLEDDRNAQPSENIIPVSHKSIIFAYPEVGVILDAVSKKLTTSNLAEMNRQYDLEQVGASEVASRWLKSSNLLVGTKAEARKGLPIVVGSANFAENQILAEIYTQALNHTGYPAVHRKSIGNRETYLPVLERGEFHLILDYVGSLQGWLNTLEKTSAQELTPMLRNRDLISFAPAPAENKNGIVVTSETARRYGLVKVSDLAKPVPKNL